MTFQPPNLFTRDAFRVDGFSLVELMAVIAIIGIMATTMTLSLERMSPRYEYRKQVREVANFVEETQVKAILSGTAYTLFYDISTHQYWRQSNSIPEHPERSEYPRRDVKTLEKPYQFVDIDLGSQRLDSGPQSIQVSAQGKFNVHAIHFQREGAEHDAWTIAFTGPGGKPEFTDRYVPLTELIDDEIFQSEDRHLETIRQRQ